MNPAVAAKNQNHQLLFVKNRLSADAGKVPERLELIRAGKWENSWKGDLEILIADLWEMKRNFDKGVGLAGDGSEGAPIDFSHEEYAKAAGWIKAVEVDEANGILYASEIEWSAAGIAAIEGKEFKFFSPSVYPACLGSWFDPEDPTHTAQNVLMGGGLTNIPFFKALTGLKASRTPEGKENVIYLAKEGEDMILAEVIAKDPTTLSPEEKTFLTENKAELTAEQQITFGIVETPVVPADPAAPSSVIDSNPAPVVPVDPATVALQASLTAGTHVVIEKQAFEGLQASAQASANKLAEMEKEKITGRVNAAVSAGRIKSDQAEKWVNRIVADATILEDLEALPENQLLASELGSSQAEGSAKAQFAAKLEAARGEEANKGKSEGDLISIVRHANPEIRDAYDKEIKGE